MRGGRGGGGGRGDMNRRGNVKNQMGAAALFWPEHMKALFKPREPLPYLPPPTRLRDPAAPPAGEGLVGGLAEWTSALETGPAPPRHHDETPWQRRDCRRAERDAAHAAELAAAKKLCAWEPGGARARAGALRLPRSLTLPSFCPFFAPPPPPPPQGNR